MKRRGLILFCMILLLAGIAYAVTTSNPRPTIKVRFDEVVSIVNYNLTYLKDRTDIKLTYDGVKEITGPPTYYRHNFTPVSNLVEGDYNFTVEAEDLAGNRKNSSLNFTVKFEPLIIDIKEPPYGVSNKSTINIIINTSRNSACKYRISSITIPPAYTQMSDFDAATGFEFRKNNYALTEQAYLHVKCIDQLTNKEYKNLSIPLRTSPFSKQV